MIKKIILKHKPLFTCLILFPIIFLIYGKFSKPVFESSGAVTIFRSKVENPHFINEELRNRWIWIRDGLSVKANILNHNFLKSLVENNEVLKTRLKDFIDGNKTKGDIEDLNILFLENLKKGINIDYTGGDENSYLFKVKDSDKALPKFIINELIKRVKYLFVDQVSETYATSLDNLEKNGPKGEDVESIKRLLKVSMVLEESQKNLKFQITLPPYAPIDPIWPSHKILLLIGLLLGAIVGIFLEYLIKYINE